MEWINILEKLPSNYERVLVFSKERGILTAVNKDPVFGKSGTFFHSPGKLKFEDDKIEDVTHWQPLPTLPKEPSK